MTRPITIAILTCSDRCARGEAEDKSGPALAEIARTQLAAKIVATACVPDDVKIIGQTIQSWAKDPAPDLILTTGGTGLGPRDVTPEATLAVLERRHPALLELARFRCYPNSPRASLARGEAGTLGRTLVINFPGSTRGASESLTALLDVLPHAVEMLRDGDHD